MFQISIIVLCLLLNAILSAVEMAFVTVSKPHLKKLASDGDRLALKILNLKSNPERVLSVLQIGITLVGAISAAVGGASADEALSPWLMKHLPISERWAAPVAIAAVVIPLTYFSVVIGELVPKTLALRYPMRLAKFGAFFLNSLGLFFHPIVSLLEVSTKLILNLFVKRLGTEAAHEPTASVDIDALSETHKQYVLNLIDVDKRKAKDILLPWDLVIKIDSSAHQHEVLDVIKKSKHTRLPIISGENVIGILHAKEFISEREITKINWLELVRPVIFLNPEEPILNALKILQNNKNHMAIIKKQNQLLGVVTLEDIFEEVVGEIYDEDDSPQVLLSSNARIRTMNLPSNNKK